MENAHDGHRQRIRDKLLTNGPESMKPHEIVEFLLYYCVPRQNTNPLAHALLDRFGNLQSLFAATEAEMCDVDGMSPHCARWLRLVGDCVNEYIDAQDRDVYLKNRRETRRYMERHFAAAGTSGCWLLCLSATGCMTHILPLQEAAQWYAPENMRRAVAQALDCRAHSIVLARRAENAIFTQEDVERTAELMESLALINITLIEHMVMSRDGQSVDYATNPLLYRLRDDPNAVREPSTLHLHWLL